MSWSWRRMLLVALTLHLYCMVMLLVVPRFTMEVAYVVLTPWLILCRAITPEAWQTLGNVLLGMLWLLSGILVYALLAGLVVEAVIGVLKAALRSGRKAPGDAGGEHH